jgi:hypothetical protein
MNASLLRAAFTALLLATLASKAQTSPTAPTDILDIRAGITDALARQGLAAREDKASQGHVFAGSILFDAPGCDRVVRVVPVSISLWEGPLLNEAIGSDDQKHFLYLDGTWLTEDRIGIRLEWLKHRSLAMLGLSRYIASPFVLLVVEPRGCDVVKTVDWRSVWEPRARPSAPRQRNINENRGAAPS